MKNPLFRRFGLFALLLIGVLVSASSCRTTQVVSNDGSVPVRTSRFLTKKMKAQRLEYEWFAAKAKIEYVSMTQNRNVRASIRIKKDEMIWASFAMFGIEGVRAKITPDSVYMLNRLEKQYLQMPLSYFADQFNVPADFATIESLLVGTPILPRNDDFEVSIENNQYILRTVLAAGLDGQPVGLSYALDGTTFEWVASTLRSAQNQTLDLELGDYQQVGKRANFAHSRKLLLDSADGNARVTLDFSRVKLDEPQRMEFNIPSNYTLME